ncbi:MAG: endolytic transglycosylase MltG [Armatimonadota bacterium]|nr:endolytic transglycosylase MltG [Armatimonadota bacterium]
MKKLLWLFVILSLAAGVGGAVLFSGLGPVSEIGKPRYFRIEDGETISAALERLERDGIINSASSVRVHHRIFGGDGALNRGTYVVNPADGGDVVLKKLLDDDPVRQMVLVREGLWVREVAATLEAKLVAPKHEVLAIVADPAKLGDLPRFIVPSKGLEGYLYPETYDLPPLLGAEDAVRRMLAEFERDIYEPLGKPDAGKLRSWVIIGSMVELEAKRDDERKRIAGVIYNRLMKGMPLQIDATVVYGLGERRTLKNADYLLDHPYNTYKLKALPPGPICSPRAASVFAAAKPEKHAFFYYVAMPDGTHKFGRTYQEHLHNVNVSRKAHAAQRPSG